MFNSSSNPNITSAFNYPSQLNSINNLVNKIINIIILSVGIPGNLISIVVFVRLMRKNKSNNMGMLYTLQCLFDMIVIIWAQFATRYDNSAFGFTISNVNDSLCKLTIFVRRASLHFSSWIGVITSFDRFVFVFYEHHARFQFMKRKRNLLVLIAITFALLAIADIPNFFYYLNGDNSCSADFLILLSSDLILIIFRTYVPIGLMVYFNVNMIRKLTRKKSAIVPAVRQHEGSRRPKENYITLAVISHDVIFFVTHFPISIMNILYDVNLYSIELVTNNNDPLAQAVFNFALMIILNFSFFDKTFSIFAYFAFNKLFRAESLALVARLLPYYISSLVALET